MQRKKPANNSKKRDIMIAILLIATLLLSISASLLISLYIGTPVNLGGKVENIRVKITEVCTRNRSLISDSEGNYSDYIELYNAGETFNLFGFALTDGVYKEVKYVFGSRSFASGEYIVIFLDGKNVPFSLKGEGGETVYMLSPDSKEVTSVKTEQIESDMVMSLQDGRYVITSEASPGYPNTPEGRNAYIKGLKDGSGILAVNEIITGNKSVLCDKQGKFSDILEIINTASYSVSTSGWYISDSTANPHRFALPDKTLEPGECMVIFCDGTGKYEDGELHASFGFSAGEKVVLSGPDGKFAETEITDGDENTALCRVMSENGSIVYQRMSPSPGFSNTEEGVAAFLESRIDRESPVIITEVLLKSDELAYGGYVCDVIELTNRSKKDASTEGYFISDDLSDPYKYALPDAEIKAGECIVIFADSKNTSDEKEIHANFSLSKGETLYLMTPGKKQSLPLAVVPAGRGNSWAYTGDGEDIGYASAQPSIGFPNSQEGIKEYAKSVRPKDIEISEAVSVNTKYLPGPYGEFHDFIELHNNSGSEVSLNGMFLSDDSKNLGLAPLPDIKIPADGYVVFILSADGANTPAGYKVLPFNLSSEGETVYLSKDGKVLDCIVIPKLTGGVSYGRANGSDIFSILESATPKAANSAAVQSPSPKPTSTLAQGVYNGVDSISVGLNGKGAIHYTLDCSEPSPSSPVYKGEIKITKTTVIRARCYTDGHLPSEVLDLLYVVNEGHSLEVASIITNPDNLWDYYKGIYADGPGADPVFPHVGANYWQNWEKEATVSFFASDKTSFSEKCGIRIFGAFSRAVPMKSFTCFFRAKYGASQLNYKLFPQSELSSFEAFVFRNTGQDFNRARMRDVMMSSLVAEYTSVDVQKYRPVVLYLNGEFWGVYFIREKLSENYIAGNYNVPESAVILARATGKQSEEYMKLINYVKSHDLSDEDNYNYVLTQLDKDNYIDYLCAEIYIANTDNGNIRFYKSDRIDGKWRWIMYDTDWGFTDYKHPTVAEHFSPNGTGASDMFPTTLINALLKNKNFKDDLIKRLAWQMNNIWTNEKVQNRINELKALIKNDMTRDCQKWNLSYANWERHTDILMSFQKNRQAEVYRQVKNYFSLSDEKMAEYGFKRT